MDAAWEQVGDVLEANRRIRCGAARRARRRSVWYDAHLAPLLARRPQRALAADRAGAARACSRAASPSAHRVSASLRAAGADVGARCARASRPARPAHAQRCRFDAARRPRRPASTRVERRRGQRRAAEGHAARRADRRTTSPTRLAPAGVPPVARRAAARATRGCRARCRSLLAAGARPARCCSPCAGVAIVVAACSSARRWRCSRVLARWRRATDAADGLRRGRADAGGGRRAADEPPTSRVTEPGGDAARPPPGGTDSAEATRFKAALRDVYGARRRRAPRRAGAGRTPLDLRRPSRRVVVTALDPARRSRAASLARRSRIPPRIRDRASARTSCEVDGLPGDRHRRCTSRCKDISSTSCSCRTST